MRDTIAIIEAHKFHDELLPTAVTVLRDLGFRCRLFLSSTPVEKGILRYSGTESGAVQPAFGERRDQTLLRRAYHLARRAILGRGYREQRLVTWVNQHCAAAWVNSLDTDTGRRIAASLRIPVLGVVHNARRIVPEGQRSGMGFQPFVLANHISDFLRSSQVESRVFHPIHLGSSSDLSLSDKSRFCVQGNFEFSRRNYTSLLSALDHLTKNPPGEAFLVRVVGRRNLDLTRFEDWVGRCGAREHFEVFDDVLAYSDYYGRIRECEFILPMIDRSACQYWAYYEDTASSTINLAIAFGVIPVVNKELAMIYGIEEACVLYEGDLLELGMRQALELEPGERLEKRKHLREIRDRWYQKTKSEITEALAECGVLPAPESSP